jgi:hypothetical protein
MGQLRRLKGEWHLIDNCWLIVRLLSGGIMAFKVLLVDCRFHWRSIILAIVQIFWKPAFGHSTCELIELVSIRFELFICAFGKVHLRKSRPGKILEICFFLIREKMTRCLDFIHMLSITRTYYVHKGRRLLTTITERSGWYYDSRTVLK